ncbi:MAG: DNA polymerase III subunit gamma/tau [Actinobacteria bacterium]|nr:DNA polymerase III subunit gamma/tau [Actinomycetota bacterium]
MGYISFYRKWRPQSFEEIIGQDFVVQTLKNAISRNRLSHSYIFCGPKGTGKTSTARILAKALNCIKGPTPEPCNKCDNCISISNGSNVDVVEIDAASNRGIDEIRDLREKVKYLPSVLRKKVYIIDEVHMLTPEAFNALLKVLEEPPEHVLFIMATTEPHKVIPTIMSRCQRFDFSPIRVDEIKRRLREVSEKENIFISEPALNIISKYADGSLRDADSILEKLASYGDNEIDVQDVTSLLGVVDIELLFEFGNIIIEKNLEQGFLFIDRLLKSAINLRVFVSEFLDHLYNLYVIRSLDNPWEVLDVSLDYKDRYLTQSQQLSDDHLRYLVDLFSDLYKQIRWGEGSRIVFKTAIIKAIEAHSPPGLGAERVFDERIKKLEDEISFIRKKLEEEQALGYPEGSRVNGNLEDRAKEGLTGVGREKKGAGYGIKKDSVDKLKEGKSQKVASKKIVGEDKGEEIIYRNWKEICLRLKSEKIPVHAMFIECKSCRIDGEFLCFYLDENRKWHRDQLSKESSINLISKVIKEVTGRDYKIRFELEDISNRRGFKANTNLKDLTIEGNEGKDSLSDTNLSDASMSEDDILDYFERKFEIKE